MSLPEQIKRQSAAIQELYKNMNEPSDPPTDSTQTTTAPTPTPTPPVQTPPVAPTAQTPPTPTVQTTPVAPPPTPAIEQDSWEQRYRTLQGMYNAEVPALRAENADVKARLANLEQLLANPKQTPSPATTPKKHEPVKLITDKDVEEYGDAIDVMRKAAQEEAEAKYGSTIAELVGTVNQLKSQLMGVVPQVTQVAQSQALSREQAFWSTLNTRVPDWEEINGSADFQTWLLTPEPMSGLTRQTFLEDAQNKLEADRVVAFFTQWKNLTTPPQVTQPNTTVNVNPLEKHISPGTAKSQVSTVQNQPNTVYTRADVRNFYSDVAKGKYRGRDDDRARMEQDIFAAQRDGRIKD